jgi:manganese/zinc/iron transport system substrate-binding protein
MDPALWAEAIPAVRDTLTALDPEGRQLFEQRATAYATRLAELDAYAKRAIATIPEDSRILLTAHDAFGYFGRAYGLDVRGVQGISTESEAGVQDIERLVELIASRGIRAIFVESTVSERNINAIIAGAKARGHTVLVGGSLYSDAMGKPGTWEGTYIGMLEHNVRTITEALGGTVPEGGPRESSQPSTPGDDPH